LKRADGVQVVALDLVRGVAALAVFLTHVRNSSFVEFGALPLEDRTTLAGAFFGVSRLGHEAVMVFFVLSGFLVGGQILRRLVNRTFDLRVYMIDRATRIWLPLVPACIVSALVGAFALEQPTRPLQIFLNAVGLNEILTDTLPSNAPLWTLAYEIWFYVTAGAFGYLVASRFKSQAALVFGVVCMAIFSILSARYLLYWGLGASMIFLLDSVHRRKLALLGGLLFLAGVGCSQLAGESRSVRVAAIVPLSVAEAMLCCGFSLLIPFLSSARANSMLVRLTGAAAFLSSISYTLYLLHFPLLLGISRWPLFERAQDLSSPAILACLVKAIAVFTACYVFYLVFERNTAALRRYLRSTRELSIGLR